MKNLRKNFILGFFFITGSFILSSCVPQGNELPKHFDVQSLVQSPVLSGDFEDQNQLASVERVFTLVKDLDVNESELTSVALISTSPAFSVQSSGCERILKRSTEKCFVRVKLTGSKLISETPGIKTAILTVGSLSIDLSVNYQPLEGGDIEVSTNQGAIEESMDYECFSSSCDLILRYKNKGLVAQQTAGVVVPSNYTVVVNSCNTHILPNKSCAIRLRLKSIPDLEVGEVSLNVNGQTISTNVRVIQESDTIAPAVSTNVLNSVDIDGHIFVADPSAQLELSFSDNRDISKGLKYSVSSGSSCSSSTWISTTQSVNTINHPLISNQDNVLSIMVKDALENKSDCISLTIKDLNFKSFMVSLTQPTIGGNSLSSSSNSVLYMGSVSINYTSPGIGYELSSWTGDCAGQSGEVCSLLNINRDVSVGADISCRSGYHQTGLTCTANTQSCLIPNGVGLQTWSGSSWGSCDLQSCNANFTPNNNNDACLATIITNGSSRNWADGSYAVSCNDYRNPGAGKKYQGSTGTGSYTIQPIGSSPYVAHCDQVTDNGGWTLNFRGDVNYTMNTKISQLINNTIETNASEVMTMFVNSSFGIVTTPYKFSKPAGFNIWTVGGATTTVSVTNLSNGISANQTLVYGHQNFPAFTCDGWHAAGTAYGRLGICVVSQATHFNSFPFYSGYNYGVSPTDFCAISNARYDSTACSSSRFLVLYYR